MSQSLPSENKAKISLPLRVWDILFWATVLLPLLTGGIWIRRPGLKLELTQVSIPLAVLSLWGAYFLYRKRRAALESTSSLRFVLRAWGLWRKSVEERPALTLFLATLFFGTLWSWVSLNRHWAFLSGFADLGIFLNAIWNLTHGNGYVSSLKNGMNLFADHQSPIFWFTAPFFKLYPHPETLLVLQGFGLCAGAPALYLIGRQYLSKNSAWLAALPLLYWFFNPLRSANRFDFHPEVFLVPFFLYGIWGLQEKTWGKRCLGLLFMVLALMGKESSGPVMAGIGAAWILGAAPASVRGFCRALGPFFVAAGVGHIYFCTKVVPTFFAGAYLYQNVFAHFGNGLTDLILAPFTKPALFFSSLFNPKCLRFLAGTTAPLGFLSFLSPNVLVASIPGYLIYFLMNDPHRLNLGYHYAIESSVGVFWALTVTFAKFERPDFLPNVPRWLVGYLLFVCLFVSYGRSEIHYIRFYQATPHHAWVRDTVIPAIDPNASTMSTGTFVPHLANRPWAHHLPVLEVPNRGFVDCVIWSRHPEVNNTPMNEPLNQEILKRMMDNGFKEVWACDSLSVYQNPAFRGNCLPTPPPCDR